MAFKIQREESLTDPNHIRLAVVIVTASAPKPLNGKALKDRLAKPHITISSDTNIAGQTKSCRWKIKNPLFVDGPSFSKNIGGIYDGLLKEDYIEEIGYFFAYKWTDKGREYVQSLDLVAKPEKALEGIRKVMAIHGSGNQPVAVGDLLYFLMAPFIDSRVLGVPVEDKESELMPNPYFVHNAEAALSVLRQANGVYFDVDSRGYKVTSKMVQSATELEAEPAPASEPVLTTSPEFSAPDQQPAANVKDPTRISEHSYKVIPAQIKD